MRRYAWIVMVFALALILGSFALAQEKEYETTETEEAAEAEEGAMPMIMKFETTEPGTALPGQMPYCPLMKPGAQAAGKMQPMAGHSGMGQCCMGCMGCCGMGMGAGNCPMGGPGMMCIKQGRGPGCGMAAGRAGAGMGCGMMGKDAMSGGMCQMGCPNCYTRFADELELTDKQVSALKTILSEQKKAMIRKQADIKIAETELHELLGQDVPDFAKAKSKLAQIATLKESLRAESLNNLEKSYKVLTAEQQKEFRALMKGGCGAGTPLKMQKRIKVIEKKTE
jgi:Spy/CpxP family protein refolding chaperone